MNKKTSEKLERNVNSRCVPGLQKTDDREQKTEIKSKIFTTEDTERTEGFGCLPMAKKSRKKYEPRRAAKNAKEKSKVFTTETTT